MSNKIPNGTTPIKHEVLTEVFAKGLLSYAEMRIALFIIRWSWGYHHNDTQKDFTITQIAKEINMNRGSCSTTLNKMLKENKLIKKNSRYVFNEHFEEWGVLEKATGVAKSNVGKSNSKCWKKQRKVLEKATVSVGKSNSRQPTNTDDSKPAQSLKVFKDIKIYKDINNLEKQVLEKLQNIKIYPYEEEKDLLLIRGLLETRKISERELLNTMDNFMLYCEGPYKKKKNKNPRLTLKNFFRDFPFKKQDKGGFYDVRGNAI